MTVRAEWYQSVVSEKGLSKLCILEKKKKKQKNLCINGDFNATSSIFESHYSFEGKKSSTFETR